MKSIAQSKKYNKKIIIAVALSAIIIIGAGLFWYYNKNKEATGGQDATITIKEKQVDINSEKTNTTLPPKTKEDSTTTDPGDHPVAETPSTPPEKPVLERAGGDPTIKVVATFQQASSGYCELELTRSGSDTVKYESKIVLGSTYYLCSFSVARSALPSGGTWSATVIHHIGEATTRSDTRELN